MWICRNCGTENEDNFKFCWSCGQTQEKSKPVEIKQKAIEITKTEPVREVRKVEEETIEETIKPQEPKPVEIPRVEKRRVPQNEPELFATVLPYSTKVSNDETDWEIKVFRIAVRLVGLFLLYQVFITLPDLTYAIYDQNNSNADKLLTKEFIAPIAKLLFYFIVGIYLIASGRILIWLLPDR